MGPNQYTGDSSLSSISTSKRKSSCTGTLTWPPAFSSWPASCMLVFVLLPAAAGDKGQLASLSPIALDSLLGSSYSSANFWYAVSIARESCSEKVTNFLGGGAGFASSWWFFKSFGLRFGICESIWAFEAPIVRLYQAYIHGLEPPSL